MGAFIQRNRIFFSVCFILNHFGVIRLTRAVWIEGNNKSEMRDKIASDDELLFKIVGVVKTLKMTNQESKPKNN